MVVRWMAWVGAMLICGLLVVFYPVAAAGLLGLIVVAGCFAFWGRATPVILIAGAALGFSVPLATLSNGLEIRFMDIALGVALLLLPAIKSRSATPLLVLVPFVAWAGLRAEADPASWARFALTAVIGVVALKLLTTPKMETRVVGAICLGASINIGLAVVDAAQQGLGLGARYGGLVSVNTLGLVSCLLVAASLTRVVALHRLLLVPGLMGLVVSKSIGGFVATGAVLLLFIAWRSRGRTQRAMRMLIWGVVGVFALWGFVNVARPDIVADPFSSSTAGRLVLGVVGMELFYDSPIVGVGWRQSSNPGLIASPEVIGDLRAQFPGVSRNLFPNTTVETSVHNAYIQVLAELGLIGAGLSLFAALKLNRRLKRMPRDPLGNFYRLALFGILVWWNDNPLYGGQTESISFFLLIGAALAHQNVTPLVSTSTPLERLARR
jgi:hypothetical protein